MRSFDLQQPYYSVVQYRIQNLLLILKRSANVIIRNENQSYIYHHRFVWLRKKHCYGRPGRRWLLLH